MKTRKIVMTLALIMSVFTIGSTFAACSDKDDDRPIQKTELPQAATLFINTYFPGDQIQKMTMENKGTKAKYEVKFVSGAEVDFDYNGAWTDVDMPQGRMVPEGIVPSPIVDYVTANYPGQGINEISVDRYGYDVELINGIDLEFDANGQFIRVDR